MKLQIILFILSNLYLATYGLLGIAQLTYYESYARCCPNNPNYSPSAPTSECSDYSACQYPGYFAGISGQKPLSWVQSNNIVSFYDSKDRYGISWKKNFAGKTIRLTKAGKSFNATIWDTCGDNDCGGCCYRNSKGGYLVDLEYYTVLKNLGSLGAASGQIEFEIYGI